MKSISLPNGSTDVKNIAVSPDGKQAYVTHLLARYQLPTNQVDRGWMSTNMLSIIDLNSLDLYNSVLIDTPQKGASNPWGVDVSDDGKYIAISVAGTHEIALIDRNKLNERLLKVKNGNKPTPSSKGWDNVANDAGFLYGIRDFIKTNGKGNRGIVFNGNDIITANYFSGDLTYHNLNDKTSTVKKIGKALTTTPEGEGEFYFNDAMIGFQSWQSCASCHPNDARVDGMNWDLLNDGMGNPKNTKSLLYSHQTPPCMATGIRKDAPTAEIGRASCRERGLRLV